MFNKNQSKYYYDYQMSIRLNTTLDSTNSELNEINSLFELFKQNESREKIYKLQEKLKHINNKYKTCIDKLKYELLKCNKRLKYNNSKF